MMTTELVLLMFIYAFILLSVFGGDSSPFSTFDRSAPSLAARIERNVNIGHEFKKATDGSSMDWDPPRRSDE